MNRNFMVNCPRTPAPVRNSSFLTSAAAVLETPTLLRKPASSSTNENVARSTSTLQPPSAASTAAMQFLMFNQMQSAAFTSSSNGGTPFQRNAAGKAGLVNGTSGFNFTIPNIPDSTTTVTTRIIENLQIANSNAHLKRKHDEGYGNAKLPAKRVQFEPLPLKPRNQANNGNRWSSKAALPALTAGPSKQPSPAAESSKPDVKKLRILTGSVEHIMKLSKTSPGGSPLVEVFANVLTIKAGAYECEKILLLRNRTGPVMQGVFYEIDFHMPPVNVGDLVRCVGRLTGGSRLQILKITLATPEEERMGHRLQTMDESRPIPMFRCEQIESGKLAKEWKEWKGSLQYYFDSYQITDQKLMRAKMLHFGGPQLQKVFQTLDGTEEFPLVVLNEPWYDVAIDRLDQYFKPRKQDVLERHKLRNLRQLSNERFAHYVLRLRQQLMECGLEKYPVEVRTSVEEMMLIDVIVEGCASQELRRRILEKDQSLSDIEALGASLESVRNQEKEMNVADLRDRPSEVYKVHASDRSKPERKPDHAVNRFPTRSVKTDREMSIRCFACGLVGHTSNSPTCPAKGRTCRSCKAVGHFEKVCRKRRSTLYSTAPVKKVRVIEDVAKPEQVPEPMTDEPERKVYYTFHTGNNTNVFDCKIGGVTVEMLVDSGSDVNLVTAKTWDDLKRQQVHVTECEKGSKKILQAYGNDKPLEILGTFTARVEVGTRAITAEFFVTLSGQRNLLGDVTSKQLGILKIGMEVDHVAEGGTVGWAPYPKITGIKIHIQMNPEIVPVFQPVRRIPIPLEGAVNAKLDELLARDIIEVKNGPASWVSPLVVANKANGAIRLCVDLRRVNQAVVRERHPMPIIDDIMTKIGKGKIWSVLDVKDAFFLLELDDESKDVATFITHRGLYRFKRLPFGLVSAPEIFQRTMDGMLADCEGAYWYLDDVGVEGSTLEEHDARLEKVLGRFKENGVVLNWDKCKLRVTDFEFLGYKISPNGIEPIAAKRDAVMSFRRPSNESEVRSFLGLANYMGKFIPNLAETDEPLRKLTQKGIRFHWGDKEEHAFNKIKFHMANAKSLGFYKTEDDTTVIADASPNALGAVLIQTECQTGQSRVICYASKSLTDTERRYCHTEKEALALVWGVERFQNYLIGKEFNLVTDCKALTFLFTPSSRPCARIERWVLRLQGFQYKVVYTSGPSNIADVLSRLSVSEPRAFDDSEELMVREIVSSAATAVALKWQEIQDASKVDEVIGQIFEALETGTSDELPLPYKMIFAELCRVDDVLLRGDRIVIPQSLQQRVLKLAHEGHPGMRIMKGHLRANVWWSKMDTQVEQYVKSCRSCSLVSAPNAPEPMIRKTLPSRPWEQIAIDFLGPLPDGVHLLVCVDYYSRYLEVIEMSNISTASTVQELLGVFSRYGVPETLRADNGPQFSSEEFRMFCEEYGIHLVSTIPYWPQMNGEVERQNRSILKRLKIAQELGNDWRKELRQYLLMYHSATHSTTGKAPSELMFGRRLRSKLPNVPAFGDLNETVRDRDMLEKEKGRVYADNHRKAKPSGIEIGDTVLAKRMRKENKLSTEFSPEEFTVLDKKGTDVTIRSSSSGKTYNRSAAHLKVVSRTGTSGTDPKTNQSNLEQNPEQPVPSTSRDLTASAADTLSPTTEDVTEKGSKRRRVEPSRLKDYFTY